VLDVSLTDEASLQSAVSTIISAEGRIDVLVNNAGISGFGVAESFTAADVQQMFDVNTFFVADYQAIAEVPKKRFAAMTQMFETNNPNPQDVADAVVKLINTSKGQRPLRTVVDPSTGEIVERANNAIGAEYANVMKVFGIEELLG